METAATVTPFSLPASVLNRFISMSQTGVSREGTAQRIRTVPARSLPFTSLMSVATSVKFAGALSPALISGPSRSVGTFHVTAPFLISAMMFVLLRSGRGGPRVSRLPSYPTPQAESRGAIGRHPRRRGELLTLAAALRPTFLREHAGSGP